jgi:hypothetical protein
MFKSDCGKLTVHASTAASPKQRLQSVRTATQEMARRLNMDFEVIKQAGAGQIYVYYENGDEDPIPLYCDEGKSGDLAEISSKIRNMMFVLSFHPKHVVLKQVRQSLFTLS